ncbi:hypothetical protein FOA52_015840 [Chlamydomonas sp. UWO 241]|nr:hypothetical protein FOA52_015840 [Chlamydomonas sp. UWO 241]
MRGLALKMTRSSSMSYEDVVDALQWAGTALEELVEIACSHGSHDDARMGAQQLRERIVDCGVLPDLITALADVWSTTGTEYMSDLSKASSSIVSAVVEAINAWEPDVKRIVTSSAVAAVMTISEGLWQLELQGRTHTLRTSCEEEDDQSWVLTRFLVDSGKSLIALPKLRCIAPQSPHVARDVYMNACHLSEILHALKRHEALRAVAPDELPLLQAMLALVRTQLVYRVSWGIWGGLQLGGEGEPNGTQLQNAEGEGLLARITDVNVSVGMHDLLDLLSMALPALREGDAGVLAGVAHNVVCDAWAVLALDPLSPSKQDVQAVTTAHARAVQVLLMLHTADLLRAAPPVATLSSRLLEYPRARQRTSESGIDVLAFMVYEAQMASQLAHLLMVVASKYDERPGALEAAFPAVAVAVGRVVAQVNVNGVSALHNHLLRLPADDFDRCALEPGAVAAAVEKIEAVIHCWRGMPNSVSPLLRELGRACVLLQSCVEQASDRSCAALQLLPAIASLGAVVLDSSSMAVRTTELLGSLKKRSAALEAKLKAKAGGAVAVSRDKAKPALNAVPDAAIEAAGGSSDKLVSNEDSGHLEEHTLLLEVQQFETLGGATTLKLVAAVAAAVLAP